MNISWLGLPPSSACFTKPDMCQDRLNELHPDQRQSLATVHVKIMGSVYGVDVSEAVSTKSYGKSPSDLAIG